MRGGRYRALKMQAPTVEKVDRAAIIARDKSTCYLCEVLLTPGWELTLDHLIPLVRGGDHTAANLRVCCRPCNSKKRHLTITEYLERLSEARLIGH